MSAPVAGDAKPEQTSAGPAASAPAAAAPAAAAAAAAADPANPDPAGPAPANPDTAGYAAPSRQPRPGPAHPPPPVLLGGAALVGVAVAATVRVDAAGLGWVVAVVAAAAGVGLVGHRLRGLAVVLPSRSARIEGAMWALTAVLLVGVVAVRAAEWLAALCLLTAAGTGSLAVVGRSRGIVAGVAAVPLAALRALPWLGRAAVSVPRDHGSGLLRRLVPVLVGVLLLIVFGGLLTDADPAFAQVLDDLLPAVDEITAVEAFVLFGLGAAAVLGAGFLLLTPAPAAEPPPARATRLRLLDWALPVGLLVALFALFVGVQVTTLLKGDAHVLRSTGLTYAEYARSGFWQLLVVTVLGLAVIVVAARWAPADTPARRACKRGLLGVLTLLTLAIVASAVGRMWLYQQAYGFTVLRLLVLTCELWLGLCFLLVLVSVLRLRADGAARGMAATGVAALLVLAVLDPERFVAERNVERFAATGRIDTSYLSELSADVVPALARLPEPLRSCALQPIAMRLADRDAELRTVVPNRGGWGDDETRDEDWRSANLARAAAKAILLDMPLECPARR